MNHQDLDTATCNYRFIIPFVTHLAVRNYVRFGQKPAELF